MARVSNVNLRSGQVLTAKASAEKIKGKFPIKPEEERRVTRFIDLEVYLVPCCISNLGGFYSHSSHSSRLLDENSLERLIRSPQARDGRTTQLFSHVHVSESASNFSSSYI